MPLALLHSLLLQQCYYGNGIFQNNHHWSLTDVAMAVDVYKKVMHKCRNKDGVAQLVSQIYTDHCVDEIDHTVVEALVQTLSQLSTMTAEEVTVICIATESRQFFCLFFLVCFFFVCFFLFCFFLKTIDIFLISS